MTGNVERGELYRAMAKKEDNESAGNMAMFYIHFEKYSSLLLNSFSQRESGPAERCAVWFESLALGRESAFSD
jgi:hypothetical protein